ncbi:hypothetical protein DPMN_102321 [Dreissena polymorpha]|uniref:Uncharacterized protein n=1 Tax=Dreissena polymorpha TaxID=45954 RepID=A0A9D4LKF4_DREPO|nr:hypothetical protein DPMN_102321 [Dreissena polymorpha]
MVTSIVQAFIPQVITGTKASLNEQIESLVLENNILIDQVAELTIQADRVEPLYNRRNCLRFTGIPETEDKEDTDKIIVDMASELGANLFIEEIDHSHRLGPPIAIQRKA